MTPETKTKHPLPRKATHNEPDFSFGWREEMVRKAGGEIEIIQIPLTAEKARIAELEAQLKALQEQKGNG